MMTQTKHAENIDLGCRFYGEPDRRPRRRSARPYASYSTSKSLALVNPFKFSSEHWDYYEIQIYYGLRYYAMTIGRWLSRDPIGIQDGLNLYAFCMNNAVNTWDVLGNAK